MFYINDDCQVKKVRVEFYIQKATKFRDKNHGNVMEFVITERSKAIIEQRWDDWQCCL